MSSPDMGVGTVSEKQEEAARLGPHQRLIGTLFSPGETFQDIGRKPDWIVPIVIAIIFTVAGNLIITNRLKVDPEAIARRAIEQSLQQRGKSISDLTDQQKEAIESQVKMSVKIQKAAPVLAAIFIPISIAFLSLLFWGAGILLGGQTTYKKVFSVTAYSFSMVLAVCAVILNTVVAFLRNPDDIDLLKGIAMTNPGMLMPAGTNKILTTLLGQFDVLNIWFLILMTIGLAAVSKNMRPSRAAVAVFGLWSIWLVVRVGLAAIF
jgi:hypothetical protein